MTESLSSSPLKLIEFIRFQLDQLNSRNAQHEFEHLCRHFARATITPNLLPATGPVGSGGDQARDFESFTTFIASKKSDSAMFLGMGESKALVFACSIQVRGLKGKIESDVREICTIAPPHIIYFVSNQDIPVARRHALQQWCADSFSVRLEIIDGQALAEQLSNANVYWIAEQFLRVPADLFPRSPTSGTSRYDNLRAKWFEGDRRPFNHADFFEIKLGLRKATFDDKLRIDLPRWISSMEVLLNGGSHNDLRRRATYEICVGALRGQHDLTPKKHLVESYFAEWGAPTDPVQLRDATVLLSYCSTALLRGEFTIDTTILHKWSTSLVQSLESALSKASSPNSLAELLQVRAQACHLLFLRSTKPHRGSDEMFKWWFRLISAAKKAPLFPIEDFSDLLTVLTPYIGTDRRFEGLVQGVSALLEERSKGYLVAEKSRDRADAFLKSGHILSAIDELHRAKVSWFTGDTLKGTVLALLTLSEAYLNLGLIYAAKYHALGAAFLIHKSNNDEIRMLMPGALYHLGDCEYAGGEWMNYSERFSSLLAVHYQHESDPDDWNRHDSVTRAVFHFLIVRSLARALGGNPAAALVESALRSLEMPDDLREEILTPPLHLEAYERMSAAEIVAKTSKDIWGPPFADCGPVRVYKWRALGIYWSAKCSNVLSEIPHVEEFIAVLQIAIADLGRVDLCLLPTVVDLEVATHNTIHFAIEELPDNARLAFKISVPRSKATNLQDVQITQGEVLAVANTLLIWCSCLPETQVNKLLNSAYRNGLSAKAFLVRPYWELFLEFTAGGNFDENRKGEIGDFDRLTFKLREHKELAWNDAPGIGYTKAKARAFIGNRYRRGLLPIQRTLERLRPTAKFQAWVAATRAEGMLDWQILLLVANSVMNFRLGQPAGGSPDFGRFRTLANEIMNRAESDDDPLFPEEILYAEQSEIPRRVIIPATATTWGLVIRQQTPDFDALKKLLDVRYFQATDDIPHHDPFSM